jgi:predicted GIY-YIG superfamily endonuclease
MKKINKMNSNKDYGKNYSDEIKPTQNGYILYILKLENNFWYIGITNNIVNRWYKHINGNGSQWTKKHKPLEVYEIFQTNTDLKGLAEVLENNKFIEYARKYGFDYVGGAHNNRQNLLRKVKRGY